MARPRRSLRWRLFSTATLTLLLALGVAWFATRRTTASLLEDFLARELPQFVEDPPPLEDYREDLLTHHAEHGGWEGVDALLARIERELGGRYALMFFPSGSGARPAPRSRDVPRAPPAPKHPLVEERYVVLFDEHENHAIRSAPFEFVLRDAAGAEFARLFAVPELPDSNEELEGRFRVSLRGRLFLGLGIAGLVGVLLTAAVARRILRPVEALTAAARRMGSGDLSQRLDVRGDDEIGELAEAFNGMAASLARAERLRRDLVGDVAHELRTPITNARCQLEAIQDGLLPPSAEVLTSLHAELSHLGRVVDDLQELAQAEAGQLGLQLAPVDLRAELERCIGRFPAERARLRLRAEALPAVQADPDRLQQVLANLVRNALQHGPAGGVVELCARPAAAGARIEVRDEGRALPDEELALLFERFHRRDRSRSRATGGVGLGLAIVKQLVEAMHGRVGAGRGSGAGQVFWLELPASEGPARALTGEPGAKRA